jgi:hypothetical protein
MSQIAGAVIPDEPAKADEIRNPVKVQYKQTLSGSRLASVSVGLGRDDEFCSFRAFVLFHFRDCSFRPFELS